MFCSGIEPKDDKIRVRYVGKADLDQTFSEFAEMFENQQKNFKIMMEKRKNLMDRCHCFPDDSFSECLKRIREEHSESEHCQIINCRWQCWLTSFRLSLYKLNLFIFYFYLYYILLMLHRQGETVDVFLLPHRFKDVQRFRFFFKTKSFYLLTY